MLIEKGNTPIPGTLNAGLIIGSRYLEIRFINPKETSKSVIKIKGNSEGNKRLNHKYKPSLALLMLWEGFLIT
jgi:hypothetical protein